MARVLLDFRVQSGGAGRYGRELAAALGRAGADVDVHVAVFDGGRPPWSAAPFTPWGRARVARRARAWRADLVHGLHAEAGRPRGVPTVVTVQDLIPLDHPPSVPGALRRRLFARTVGASVRGAARVIAPSPATAAALVGHGLAPAAKVEVVAHGVAAVFRPLPSAEREQARRRFASGRRYVASIGHHRAHKNLGVLAQAAALVLGGHGVVWATLGPDRGPEGARAVTALDDEGLRRFYAGAEVLVLPSLIEGFGFPVVEAMACGTPVVCGPGVGALAYVADGALAVDVTDPTAVARAVGRLLEDDDLRDGLAEAGGRAAGDLTVERMAARTLAVYAEALGGRAGS